MFEILINIDQMTDDCAATRVGLGMARKYAAFVTGLHIVQVYASVMAVPEALALQGDEESFARAHAVWWENQCKRFGVESAWEVSRGLYAPLLAKRSRLADITVARMPVDAPDAPIGFDNITRTLFSDASAMLLVPDTWQGEAAFENVLVAWNGSAEAVRAIKAALPLLKSARTVRIMNGEHEGIAGLAPPCLPLRTWLSRQGVGFHWLPFCERAHAGRQMLEDAKTMHSDLLVMGAWGRPRLSELLLGGATRHVLEKAQLPVLLAH